MTEVMEACWSHQGYFIPFLGIITRAEAGDGYVKGKWQRRVSPRTKLGWAVQQEAVRTDGRFSLTDILGSKPEEQTHTSYTIDKAHCTLKKVGRLGLDTIHTRSPNRSHPRQKNCLKPRDHHVHQQSGLLSLGLRRSECQLREQSKQRHTRWHSPASGLSNC